MFKFHIGNEFGISCKWHVFELKGQRLGLGIGLTAIRRGFELYECLLLLVIIIIVVVVVVDDLKHNGLVHEIIEGKMMGKPTRGKRR